MGAFRKLIQGYRWLKDAPFRIRIRLDPRVTIQADTFLRSYRSLILTEGSSLSIGEESLIESSISMERPCARVKIGARTFIGNSRLISANSIEIGDDVLISWGCTIIDHDSHSLDWGERNQDVRNWKVGKKVWDHVPVGSVTIGDKAWIGFNVIVLKNVTIGEGAVVGAGSIVTRDVPAWSLVVGAPAKVVRRLKEH
jgi:galactoside O-acetyltransferase